MAECIHGAIQASGYRSLCSEENWDLAPQRVSRSYWEGDLLVFHAYDASTGKPALQISDLTWDEGWPHAVLGTRGESK